MKTFLHFILCIFVLCLFYYFVHIPIVPVYTLYLFLNLSFKDNEHILSKTIFFTLLFLICSYFYGFDIYNQICFYPNYGNWFGILCNCLTVFSFLSCYVTFLPSILKQIKQNNKAKPYIEIKNSNICPNCQKEISDSWLFCNNCGYKLK